MRAREPVEKGLAGRFFASNRELSNDGLQDNQTEYRRHYQLDKPNPKNKSRAVDIKDGWSWDVRRRLRRFRSENAQVERGEFRIGHEWGIMKKIIQHFEWPRERPLHPWICLHADKFSSQHKQNLFAKAFPGKSPGKVHLELVNHTNRLRSSAQ